ncbi:MAG: recombinase family protein, partial [Clostridia bacterium]|nr:recombinase family protein [Clostridia bacterium]
DRDAIVDLQTAALNGEYDVLLVFMFDRLGRRDDETPFVVEWFVQHGIEVWSATEGQQRFDSHVDKLMNYIRYWQASGESVKTSIRTKTRMGQLTEEGHYTGGSVPYGYRAVDKGRKNKRNRTVLDLEINEEEAAVVRLIFQKYVNEGMGSLRISRYLHERNISGRSGHGFPNVSINHVLKNKALTGYIINGDAVSEHIPELQIIDKDTFQKAQDIMADRVTHRNAYPLNSKGQALLVGKVYCAHCGGRLTLTTSGSTTKVIDGVKRKIPKIRYQCHYNVRHPGKCDGQSGYGMKKVDEIVDEVVRLKLAQFKRAPMADVLERQHKKDVKSAKASADGAAKKLAALKRELEAYRNETIKVIRGESKLTVELLSSLVEETNQKIAQAETALQAANAHYQDVVSSSKQAEKEYGQLLTWADIYERCTFAEKKMIVANLIKKVTVGRDYKIEIEFNFTYDEFQKFSRSGTAEL